jgi:hypothetical protein
VTAARFHLSNTQICDNSGNPASGAKINFYVAGSAVTRQNTYANAALSSANANPVVADSSGRVSDIFLLDQTYNVVITDSTGATTFATFDNVYKDVTFIRSNGLPAIAFPNMEVYNTADGKRYRRNSTNSAWIDEGPIDSVGNTAGVSDVLAGTSTSLFVTPDALSAIWERGTDIASAATITIPSTGGTYYQITGTTNISGINSQRSGLKVLFRFNGALTLTNSASLALLGGANITVAAGDIAEFTNESAVGTSGTTWRMTDFVKSDGSPLNLTSSNLTGVTATQALQEAAASTTTFVPPGRQHFHPGHIKSWLNWTSITTTSIAANYGISSVTDGGVGIHTVNFSTSFSSANYCEVYHAAGMSAGDSNWNSLNPQATGDKTAASLKVTSFAGNFGSVNTVDMPNMNFAFLGDFA